MTTTPQTNATLAEIAQAIRDNDDFVISGHVSPDGDCLGCQLALHHALVALGKKSTCVLVQDEPVPAGLAFMPGIGDMVPAESYGGPCGVFVGVDVPNRERIGAAAGILDRCDSSITIDHHACETTMCDLVYVDPDSASASMLVWEVVKMLVDTPPIESAVCAYTGLVTDTGGFRFQNCDVTAFNVAAELVSYGVNPADVATHAFQNRTAQSLKLESLVIERMRVLAEGAAALSWVSLDDMRKFGAVKADVEPLVDTVRSLAGVRVACMLREQDGAVRGSLRSKDDTDVSALARMFGGGGHKAAAGLTIKTTLPEAIETMSESIESLLANR